MPIRSNLKGDISIAMSAIAVELGRDVATIPASIASILRAFSAAHYHAGVRDTMERFVRGRAPELDDGDEPKRQSEPTPLMRGRRVRAVDLDDGCKE